MAAQPNGNATPRAELAEYRRDVLTGAWVIIAKDRSQRPHDIEEVAQENLGVVCPFCRGNEKLATSACVTYFADGMVAAKEDPVLARGRRRRLDWQVRVIPNKYPAVDGEQRGEKSEGGLDNLFESMPAFGVHEVVIEAPDHVTSFSELTPDQAEMTLRAYQDRLLALAERPELQYAQIFKNVGAAGGASLEHSHSQIVATSILPSRIARRIERLQQYWGQSGRGLVENLLERERQEGVRVLAEVEGLLVFCPFASRFPYEVWIAPLAAEARFEHSSPARLRALSQLLQRIVSAFEGILPRPAYNFCLDTAPLTPALAEGYHWRIEVFPRLAKAAGFEWATGDFINTVPPEEAAARLRPYFGSPFA